ncbi:DUF5689 domain-containing protein [Tenacibaculum crassostreae]|uniref:DUF5689 domain-containing protein n=1 Tax=Tenacibaculum crassostreae TaxID=502683 RepID=UPI003893C520
MKTISIFKYVAIFFIALSFSSCVEDYDFTIPKTGDDINYANLKSLNEVAALYTNRIEDIKEDITTSGYVVSDDRESNFYKTLIIQDKPEDPTIGFEVKINKSNLGAEFSQGRKVYIKLNGLSIGKDSRTQSFQIGVRGGSRMYSISENDYAKHIDRSSEIATIIPTVLKADELQDSNINTLVKINNLQSKTKGLTFADPDSTYDQNRYFVSCDTFDEIILRTSGFANFKSLPIPDKKGSITAVLNKYNSSYQLKINDAKSVDFTEEYGCFNNPTPATLAEIKALYNGGSTRILQGSTIKVVITSDLAKGNISNRNAFAQEGNTGIALRFSDTYNLNLGDEIEIAVGGLILNKYNGLLQLNLATSDIINTTAGTLPTPEVITLAQALTGDYESRLVKIEGVQFKDIAKKYLGANTLTSDCTDELKVVSIRSSALFQDNQVSDKKGSITGVMSNSNGAQIYIRDETDVNFTEAYTCTSTGGSGSETLFFSELADPNNLYKARFIEIYNPTSASIDLSGWVLRRYTNGNTTSSTLDLTGSTITAGQAFVIAAYASDFQATYGFAADLDGGGIVNTNGDDNFELVDPSGNVVDVFGVPGEDGSNTNHEFEDGRAYRKSSITQGNPTYTFSEWEILNDTGAAGTTNSPQDAPGIFTPGVR